VTGVANTGPPTDRRQTTAPPLAFRAYTLPFRVPTYTDPLATAGGACTAPATERVQTVAPVVAFSASTDSLAVPR
jgi:hypothetical protein